MIIVADSSALVALAACDGLELLEALYQTLKVPLAVFEEVTQENKPYSLALQTFLQSKVEILGPEHLLSFYGQMGRGEFQAKKYPKQVYFCHQRLFKQFWQK